LTRQSIFSWKTLLRSLMDTRVKPAYDMLSNCQIEAGHLTTFATDVCCAFGCDVLHFATDHALAPAKKIRGLCPVKDKRPRIANSQCGVRDASQGLRL
jgi:hypothetical protein